MAGALKRAFLCWALLLVGCATPSTDLGWPQAAAPRAQFEAAWQADADNRELQTLEDYLQWVERFYEGNNLVPGWVGMTERLQERVPDGQWAQVQPQLLSLGAQIAAEWSKDNRVRRINTRCAAVWRDALQEALSRDDLDPFLGRLQSDVDAILSGNLDAEQIRFERYYIDEFDF